MAVLSDLHRAEVRTRYVLETKLRPFADGSTVLFPKFTREYVRWLEDQANK